jgi:hypothetical protein
LSVAGDHSISIWEEVIGITEISVGTVGASVSSPNCIETVNSSLEAIANEPPSIRERQKTIPTRMFRAPDLIVAKQLP